MTLERSHNNNDRGFTNIAKGFVFILLVTGFIAVTLVLPLMSADGPPEQTVTPFTTIPFSTTDSILEEVSFALPVHDGTRIDDGQTRWILPSLDILISAGIGFILGLSILVGYSISIDKPFKAANFRRTIVVLAQNPFTFVWSLLFASIAVLWHTGFFFYLSDKTTSLPLPENM